MVHSAGAFTFGEAGAAADIAFHVPGQLAPAHGQTQRASEEADADER
jgi:hypothetical protein